MGKECDREEVSENEELSTKIVHDRPKGSSNGDNVNLMTLFVMCAVVHYCNHN